MSASTRTPTERLVVTRAHTQDPVPEPGDTVISFAAARGRGVVRSLFRARSIRLHTYRIDTLPRPFLTELWLKLQSRGPCQISDESGVVVAVTWRRVIGSGWRALRDLAQLPGLRRRVDRELRDLERPVAETRRLAPSSMAGRTASVGAARPVYLRTDPWFGVAAGGSVGHIAGVLNELVELGPAPLFLTTDDIPTVSPRVTTRRLTAPTRFRDFPHSLALGYDRALESEAERILDRDPPSFIYARYALDSYSGLRLARHFGVPFVLEYNGSEVWIQRNWGTGLRSEALARRIERINLEAADLIVVVSRALREVLVGEGIAAGKILVNPNGVDVARFHPGVDGQPVRAKYDLGDRIVLAFIGTFGPWHGAEVLAEAFGRLLATQPAYRERVRLLWIGDGAGRIAVEELTRRHDTSAASVFAGRIPQADAPAYLAAADILVSPHVPNPDGSEFFGSPTKLFEYMALGRAIVASDLAQIGEVLQHEETAWLVPPGDPEALARGCRTLIEDANLRARIGAAARRRAVEHHTWREHTRRILDRITQLTRELA